MVNPHRLICFSVLMLTLNSLLTLLQATYIAQEGPSTFAFYNLLTTSPSVQRPAIGYHAKDLGLLSKRKNQLLHPRTQVAELFCDVFQQQILRAALTEIARRSKLAMRALAGRVRRLYDIEAVRKCFMERGSDTSNLPGSVRGRVYDRYSNVLAETSQHGEGKVLISCFPLSQDHRSSRKASFDSVPRENHIVVVRALPSPPLHLPLDTVDVGRGEFET